MEEFTPLEKAEWIETAYLFENEDRANAEFHIILPRPLADWDVYQKWEKERMHSMRDHLDKSDHLLDVGAEHGWLSVCLAQYVSTISLIEPSEYFWPNIKHTFAKNDIYNVRYTFCGFASNKSTEGVSVVDGWTVESDADKLVNPMAYRNLSNNVVVPELKIDDMGINFTALNVDVEGAELLVLQGAEHTLKDNNIKVWVSIHSDLMEPYGHNPTMLLDYMKSLGYENEYLAQDHERHYRFFKP